MINLFLLDIIEFKGHRYPKFQSDGNATRFALPFSMEVCKGKGLDIGCNRKEWAFPNSIPIDLIFDDPYDALNLPDGEFDYIHSSHVLEHINDWVSVLDYWTTKICSGGVLFLYLPCYSQVYWRVFNNRKHVNTLSPDIIKDYLINSGAYKNIFVSIEDANNSFTAFAEKL